MLSGSPATTTTWPPADSDLVEPPVTPVSTPGSARPACASPTTSTMPSQNGLSACTAKSSTRCAPSRSYCFAPPKRVPLPAATTIPHVVTSVVGRRDRREQHAPDRRLHIRGDAHLDLLAHAPGGVADDDHGSIVEEADTLPRLLALARDRQADHLAGQDRRPHAVGQPVHVEATNALELGNVLEVRVRRHQSRLETARQGRELGVDGGELGHLV